MGVTFTSSGNWEKTSKYLKKLGDGDFLRGIDSIAKKGVQALARATPVDTGLSASKWSYVIKKDRGGVTIAWTNSNTENGFPVVVMRAYGHGTGTGGYVQGINFVNPAIRPIFDEITNQVWKAVKSA